MDVMNVVLAADRDPVDGHIVRLLVGVAERKTRNWLTQPSPMTAEFVARCIQAGQNFQVFAYGQPGPLLTVSDGHLVAVPGAQTGITLDELPPYAHQERPINLSVR